MPYADKIKGREESRLRTRLYRLRHPDRVLEQNIKVGKRRQSEFCRSEKKSYDRKRNRKVKEEVVAAYGGACSCCGESTFEFLGIDHVDGGGAQHRRDLKLIGSSFYWWLKQHGFPKDGRFQLLCHNCNMAKGFYGACPHGSKS